MTDTPTVAEAPQTIMEIAERLGALQFGEFKLTAGGTSSYYFDGRLVTLDPEGSYTVANALLPVLAQYRVDAAAGPAVAAVPMVSALAAASYAAGTPIKALIVRNERKEHGTGKIIEGVAPRRRQGRGDRRHVPDGRQPHSHHRHGRGGGLQWLCWWHASSTDGKAAVTPSGQGATTSSPS